jgi:hypothetical protein
MVIVNVGELLECGHDEDIATRGCDPCVALIAVIAVTAGHGGQHVKRCAHFSVNMRMPPRIDQQRIDTALDPILRAFFPLNENIRRVGFATGGQSPGMGAKEIMTKLEKYFGAVPWGKWENCDSLRTFNDLILGLKNQIWPFTNAFPDNEVAELNDRDKPVLESKGSEGTKR